MTEFRGLADFPIAGADVKGCAGARENFIFGVIGPVHFYVF